MLIEHEIKAIFSDLVVDNIDYPCPPDFDPDVEYILFTFDVPYISGKHIEQLEDKTGHHLNVKVYPNNKKTVHVVVCLY